MGVQNTLPLCLLGNLHSEAGTNLKFQSKPQTETPTLPLPDYDHSYDHHYQHNSAGTTWSPSTCCGKQAIQHMVKAWSKTLCPFMHIKLEEGCGGVRTWVQRRFEILAFGGGAEGGAGGGKNNNIKSFFRVLSAGALSLPTLKLLSLSEQPLAQMAKRAHAPWPFFQVAFMHYA